MADDFSADLDLFGDPIPAGFGSRGRPPHLVTEKNRNKVMLLLGVGWAPKRIAATLGITPPTLKKYYFRELRAREVMLDRMKAGHLASLWSEMQKGNVAAAKEVGRLLDRADAALFGIGNDQAEKDDPAPPAGKKAQADLAAKTAGRGSDWGNDLLTQH